MGFSDALLDAGSEIWDAQKEHPFVVELAAGTLDEAAFLRSARLEHAFWEMCYTRETWEV